MDSARAQASGPSASPGVAAYVSASGVTAFGFAPRAQALDLAPAIDALAILPAGSDLPPLARPIVELLWRTSPTFRRQCARLREAAVAIVLRFDHPTHRVATHGETEIHRDGRLHARIRLRGPDERTFELLAHEIEHILEQIDEVDLPQAVADRVHGARQVRLKPAAFETRRAIVAGWLAAREVQDESERR